MVAHEKSVWFGCMLAASLFVLALAGCGEGGQRKANFDLVLVAE